MHRLIGAAGAQPHHARATPARIVEAVLQKAPGNAPPAVVRVDAQHYAIAGLGINIISNDPGDGGTLAYIAPEVWETEPPEIPADIYALGVVLYEALTGATPFSSHSVAEVIAQHLHAEPSRLSPPCGGSTVTTGNRSTSLSGCFSGVRWRRRYSRWRLPPNFPRGALCCPSCRK